MKKSWWKKAVCLGLVLAGIMGLGACGGDKNANVALAKDGVYKFQEIALPDFEADYFNIQNSFHRDGKIYMIVRLEHWSSGDGNRTDIRVVSMNEDGSDVNIVELEIPDQGSSGSGTQNPGGVIDIMPRDLEKDIETEEDTGEEEPDTEDAGEEEPDTEEDAREEAPDSEIGTLEDPVSPETDFYEYTSYGNFVPAPGGDIYGIKQYQYESYGEEYYSVQKYFFCRWDIEGKFLQETELLLKDPEKEDEWVGINNMTVAQDGTLYMILTGDSAYLMTVDAEGNASRRTELPEEVKNIFTNYDRIIAKEDGTFLALYYDENDWTKEFMATYDPAAGTVSEAVAMPSFMASKGFNTMSEGLASDLIFSDSSGIHTYNFGDEAPKLKMSFVNSDLDISYFNSVIELNDTSFVGIFNDSYKNDVNAGIFTYVKPEDIPDKLVLVLGANYVPWDMKRRVVEFNRNNAEYRIVLKEYESYNSYEDWTAGITQLNNDITTGNMPDILVGSGLPMENYAAKGLLADIGKLIEEDEELSKVEFVQNVFDAFSIDGTLYYIIPSFSAQTMIGKTSIVGDRTEWTMEDAQKLLAGMPEGTSLFGEMTRDSYFSTAMGYCASDFMDVSTGKCDFDSQRFISMMEYAKSLPEALDENYYGEDYWTNYQSQYCEDRTILMQVYINSIRDLNYNINGRFGEDVSYVGFPMEGGQGAFLNADGLYAISAKCSYTEGAWEFLRYYLTDEYQSELSWNLSVNMKYFKENAQEALEKPYWEDPETGEREYYDEYFNMNGESIVLPQMTQEQIDKAVNYILSIKNCYYSNQNVMNIINEEMGGYFSGQKTAQEVAGIIQNRVQLYVDENR